jgi:pimeloyl-ACP methyl ester carboxylesterase
LGDSLAVIIKLWRHLMKQRCIACVLILLSLLIGSIGSVYAAPITAPQADGWIPLVPPGSVSGTFTYGPEGRSPHAAGYRIPHSGGAPGEWTFKIVPQDNEAAYSYWYGPIIDNEPFAGEMFRTTSDCGQAFEGHGVGYPPLVAEGDDYGVMVYANFDKCGEAGRNATSGFTIEWVLVSAPDVPTETPTPTITPEGPSCDIAFTSDQRSVNPGETVDILLEVIAPDGSGEPWTDVMYWMDEGPGDIKGGMSTGGDGNLLLTYQAPPDFGGADEAVIAAQVPGCPQAITTVLSLVQPQGQSMPVQQTPTDTPTPTPTPAGDSTLTLQIEDDWKGVAADGISELVIIARLTGKHIGQEIEWAVTNLDDGTHISASEFLAVESRTPGEWRVCFKPQEIFAQPYLAAITAIVGAGNDEVRQHVEVKVVRPPVVLVHGVWSDSSSMAAMESLLKFSAQFEVIKKVEYGVTSGNSIVANLPTLERGVADSKDEMRARAILVERVDIVAHSMGGLISRYYMEVGSGNGPQAQQVRKLITLATPHLGSSVADWYYTLVHVEKKDCTSAADYDSNHVTQEEIDWFMKWIRSDQGMKDYALTYGQSVVDLQSGGRSGSMQDVLSFRFWQPHNVLYAIRGDRPIIDQITAYLMKGDASGTPLHDFPFNGQNKGKCGQTAASAAVRKMIGDLADLMSRDRTDGVVSLVSAGGGSLGIPHQLLTVHADHFSITSNPRAMIATLAALLDYKPVLRGATWVISQSPGHLHVYDASGNHVGLDQAGLPQIGVEGALYVPFSDALGDHELIMVPQTAPSAWILPKSSRMACTKSCMRMWRSSQAPKSQLNRIRANRPGRSSKLTARSSPFRPPTRFSARWP